MSTSASTTEGVGGFTGEEIDDVARKAAIGLGIDFDQLTDQQKAGYALAARGALTGERPRGFASHLTEDFRSADKRTPAETAAFLDEASKAEATESEFWKHARDEFDRRRSS